jgi:ATP-dependent helicase/nuclease subunit B
MSAQVTVFTGPPQSGKTERLLAGYRAVLAENVPNSAIWLCPTWRVAADVRQRLLASGGGCFSPGVVTFEKFAQSVLESAPEPIRPISSLMKRLLVRRLIDELEAQGRLKYFQPIARCGGLVDMVCDFIGELKRLEIWPEHFQQACAARGTTDKDVELLEIYAAYQQCLRENHLYDAEGLFWSARDWLSRGLVPYGTGTGKASGTPGDWHRPRLVVADGFTDFTRTQQEILEILAQRSQQLWITLPLESGTQRRDLFAKPLHTLQELQRRHAGLKVEELARPPRSAWPAMAHLEQRLFAGPRNAVAAADTTGIEILAAPRQYGELRQIAMRIKSMLVEGVAEAGQIVVAFRSPQKAGPLAAEVFAEFGIPFSIEGGATLDRSPAVRALVKLLRMDCEDWPIADMLAILGSNYFQGDWPQWQDGGAMVECLKTVRKARIPSGRKRLLEAIAAELNNRRLGTHTNEDATDEGPHPNPLPVGEGTDEEESPHPGSLLREEGTRKSPHPSPLPSCRLRQAGEGTSQGPHPSPPQDGGGTVSKVLNRLAQVLDDMPKAACLADWADAWSTLAERTGLLRAIEHNETEPIDRRLLASDREAWDRLMDALKESRRLDNWLRRDESRLDRRGALAALLDIVSRQSLGRGGDESGCVRILSAASVRALKIPYLFVADLAEKAFPQPQREDRFYSEADYQRLIEQGLPLVAHGERNREEMLLFYEVVTRATKLLHLSYPALDDSAQPLTPSPFLQEVEQACGPGRIQRVELNDLSPVPSDDEPLLSDAAFRIKAVATAVDGNIALLAGYVRRSLEDEEVEPQKAGTKPHALAKPVAPMHALADKPPVAPNVPVAQTKKAAVDNLLAALEMIHLRADREKFGPAEGMCLGEGVRSLLAAYYTPDRCYSATELERYAMCPFCFFLENWLKVEPIEELSLQSDGRDRGRLAHALLAKLHRLINQSLGRPGSPSELAEAEYDRLLDQSWHAVLPAPGKNPVAAALQEIDRRVVHRAIADYRRQHEDYDSLWGQFYSPPRPELFEVSFGLAADEPPSTPEPFELYSDRETVRITGRIDRIDVGRVANHVAFNVLDYKTGKPKGISAASVASGVTLQLPIYALAASELLLFDRDAVPWQAGYWWLAGGGFKPRQALKMYRLSDAGVEVEVEWEAIRDQLTRTVVALACSMRRGEFPVLSQNEECSGTCPFHTVCRINQVRSLEKTWMPLEIN